MPETAFMITTYLHLAIGGLVPRGGHVVSTAVEHAAVDGALATSALASDGPRPSHVKRVAAPSRSPVARAQAGARRSRAASRCAEEVGWPPPQAEAQSAAASAMSACRGRGAGGGAQGVGSKRGIGG